jgi:membrane-bound lytic murein transglycosylase D
MKHRWLVVATASVAACTGRVPATTQPVPAATPAPRTAVPDSTGAPASAPTKPSATVAAQMRADSIRRFGRVAQDSVADSLALDSLADAQPSAFLPEVPVDSAASWDLNVAEFADQPRVKYYLDYFTGRSHERFQVWLDRMGHYETYAREQFAARKLPGDFVYLALIESGFSPEAVSHASAVGMWQFMAATGRVYGLRVDSWLDERRDPIKSTDAAAHHLDDLTQRFGSHYLAAAAYNAGAGRVERGLDKMPVDSSASDDSTGIAGDNAFFSLADTRLIRDETKNYVPQLIAAAIIAKSPNKYGFDAPIDVEPFSRDSVMVDGGTGLDLIARLADTTLDAMHALNPNLLRMVTPPGERYPVRVPTGSAAKVAEAYAELPDSARRAIETHVVRPGETVTSLARHYGVAADLIRSTNRAARARSLAPGTLLVLPVSTTLSAAVLREPDPPRTTRTIVRTVIVRRGESVASVARRAGVSAAVLRRENGLSSHATLRAGEKLTARRTMVVAASRTTTTAKRTRTTGAVAPTTTVRSHVVRPGETVYGIAQKFGVAPTLLIAVNGLDKGGTVKAGQTIKIPHG